MVNSRWNRCSSVGCWGGKVLPKSEPPRLLDLSVSQDADSLFQSGLTSTTRWAGWFSQTRFLPRRCRRRWASRDGGEEEEEVVVVKRESSWRRFEVCLLATGGPRVTKMAVL
jgi:hypothetical protein